MDTPRQPVPDERENRFGYKPPLSQLLGLGERPLRRPQSTDYFALGINATHLDELAGMSRDELLNNAASEAPEVFAPVHAMRAMMQIGTEAAVDPLARLLEYDEAADYDEMDEWFLEEIPEAFGNMGAIALPRCIQLLGDSSKHTYSRLAAAISIEKIGEQHASCRGDCIAALSDHLRLFQENDPEWNGWLVAGLVNLKATEAAAVIEQAYAADVVDETIIGDWDEVQARLGLRPPLSDAELAEKARRRQAAHGWISPQEMLIDQDEEDLIEDLAQEWSDSGDEAWSRLTTDKDVAAQPSMIMPEDMQNATERRKIAKQRYKQRKAQENARRRSKQNKKSP